MEHGEDVHEALKRELYEEVLIDSTFRETLVDSATMYLERKEMWLLWLVFKVEIENLTYGVGEDADEVAFVNPAIFKDSPYLSEQLVYKFAKLYR